MPEIIRSSAARIYARELGEELNCKYAKSFGYRLPSISNDLEILAQLTLREEQEREQMLLR